MQASALTTVTLALVLGVLGVQVYATFLREPDLEAVITDNDRAYEEAVFDSDETRGVMHQVFRQNEANRELMKAILVRCAR